MFTNFRGFISQVYYSLSVLLIGTFFLSSCQNGADSKKLTQTVKPKLLVTHSILSDLCQEIAGEQFQVFSLVGPNGDAHLYEPKASDVKLLKEVSLIFANGLGFDHWLGKLTNAANYQGQVIYVTQNVKLRSFEEEGQVISDPHVWQDVSNVILMTSEIAKILVNVDPDHEGLYLQRLTKYQQELSLLDAWVKAQIDSVPKTKRQVITTHDAFGYYGDRYGLRLIAPEKWSTEAEVSAKTLSELITQIRRENIKALFIENMTDPRLIQQISQDVKAFVSPEKLYSDSLSTPSEGVDTYLKLMKHNTLAFVQGMHKN